MANEEDNAERFVHEVLLQAQTAPFFPVRMFAILDTASSDRTLALLQLLARSVPELQVINAPENNHVVHAYLRGYREALRWRADWILEIDAGYSHLPEEIPRFLMLAGRECDGIFATRFSRGGRYIGGLSRRWAVSRLGGWLARALLGIPLSDPTSGFQLFSRGALEEVLGRGVRSRGPFFQTEIKFRMRHLRLREVPITYTPTGQAVRPAAIRDAVNNLFALALQRLRDSWYPDPTRNRLQPRG